MNKIDGLVYIIESPLSRELLEEYTEGRALKEALAVADIPNEYSLVTDLETLNIALGERLVSALNSYGKKPILHLSMHGGENGISLTDGSRLTWGQLRQMLLPLMNAMQGDLLLCMSVCYGSFGCRMLLHEVEDHPFWALVGNKDEVELRDLVVAYITFYHLFFKGYLPEHCVQAMNVASGNGKFALYWGDEIKGECEDYLRSR